MIFNSILFDKRDAGSNNEAIETPVFFVDLNLDQIINAITANREGYNLKPFFLTPLNDLDTIKYRQEVMQDLEDRSLFEKMKDFSDKMRVMRRYLALIEKLSYERHKEGWFALPTNV